MTITAPPTIPQITDPSTFATRAQAWVVWQADELYPALIDTSTTLGLSTTSSSVTSNSIGLGAKTFTVETGKGYVAGQSLSIAYTTTPTNRMFAVVTSYNTLTGELVVNVQAVEGSGTYTAWSIALAFNGVINTSQLSETLFNGLTAVTPTTLDSVTIADQSDGNKNKRALVSDLLALASSVSQGNSNLTVTDAGTGKIELTVDGVIISEETLASRKSTIDGGSTLYPEFKCRAWVNFNGTGTVAILGSGNVSSITDNGVGNYTVNFTTAMPDANYAMTGSAGNAGGNIALGENITIARTTSQVSVGTYTTANSAFDSTRISVCVFR